MMSLLHAIRVISSTYSEAKANLEVEEKAKDYRAHVLKHLPKLAEYFEKVGKGWFPNEQQLRESVDAAYMFLKSQSDTNDWDKKIKKAASISKKVIDDYQAEAKKIGLAGYDDVPMMEHKFGDGFWPGAGTDNAPYVPNDIEELSQELEGIDVTDVDTESQGFPNTEDRPNRTDRSDINTDPSDSHTVQDFPSSAPYFAKSTIDQRLARLKKRREG